MNINNVYPRPSRSLGAPVADQRLTVAGTAVQFSALNERTDMVWMDIQGGDVYVTFDDSTPTSTNGHKLYDTEHYWWSYAAATSMKLIQSTTATVSVHLSEFQA
jgi:hypothetical protein